jgi:hypothetical protein
MTLEVPMRRCLIVANQTLTGAHLIAEVHARQAREPYEFHILVPASHPHGTANWTEGQALAHARGVLANALDVFGDEGIPASGEVGDENPVLAIGDVLRREHFDEILLSTLPPGVSRWLKRDLPHRLERQYSVPITHVVAASEHVS